MRRRPRPLPPPPDGVVVGTLASADEAVVAADGSVHVGGGPLRLDWFVGAADGWRGGADAKATAIGQRLVDGVPVVETSLRVPGGQLVQRVWAVADGGAEVAVLEVENRSKDAVSVALAVGGGGRVRYDGELGVDAAGTLVALARRPSRVVARPLPTTSDDAASAVGAGGSHDAPAIGAVLDGAVEAVAFEGAGGGALVWPLAHTATLRVAVVLDGTWRGAPAGLPDADAVVRGWRGHVDAGARIALPDPGLAATITTARCALLVAAARPHPAPLAAGVGAALGAWGHHEAALAPIEHLLDLQRLDGSFDRTDAAATGTALAAWATHVVATGDAAVADRLAEPAAKAAARVAKLRWKSAPPAWVATAQLDAAALLDVAAQPDAAALCRSRATTVAAAAPAALGDLLAAVPSVGRTDLGASVRLLATARRFLVEDDEPGRLRLLPAWPEEWLGADLEAHRLPTRAGTLSFAIRWHGARPALLWELDGAATTTVPGLDPGWSTADPSGEALLAAVEPAGGLPGVVRPLAGEGTPVDDAPEDGTSFA